MNFVLNRSAGLLLICCLLGLTATALSAWTVQDYSKNTPEQFFQQPEVQQRINFAHPDTALLDAAVFYQTNLIRMAHGAQPLIYLPGLELVARSHAQDMVTYTYFSHTSPIAGQHTVQERLASVGIHGGVQGENIARGFALDYDSGRPVFPPQDTGAGFRYSLDGPDILPRTYVELAQALLDQLMASPDHRAIILGADFRFLGCAVVLYPATNFFNMQYFMAVQDFSSVRPKS